jgi:hypothetical protein
MRRTAKIVALAIAVGLGMSVLPWQAAAADDDAAAPATKLSEPAASQTDVSQPGESWRYRRHNGQWWYWLPSEKWAVWSGDRWTAYEAKSYSTYRAARPQQSSSYPADQGNWGPVRYNRFGQVEYPYSQRKTGIRQLGPVPAMGGVRSLPGWGGER